MSLTEDRILLETPPRDVKAPTPRCRVLFTLVRRHPLARRMASGAFWSIVSSGLTQSLALFSGVIVARRLGSAEYGEYGIILATVNLFTAIGAAGLGVTATKHVAELRDSDPGRAGRIIGTSLTIASVSGLFVGLGLFTLATWLSSLLRAPGLAPLLRLSAGLLFFSSVNGYQAGALAGFEAFKSLAAANLVRGVAGFPLIVLAAIRGGLTGAVAANVVMGAVSCIAHEIMVRRECRRRRITVSYRFQPADVQLFYRFSLPVLIASLSYTPAIWASNAILARSSGFTEVGILNAAMQWQVGILFFASAVANLGLPMLSNALPERNFSKYKRLLAINFLITTGVAFAVAIPVALASPWIMRAYGTAFGPAWPVLIVVAAATALSAMNISVGQAIWSLDAAVAGMVLALLRGAVLVVASWLLAPLGARGLALAHLVTALIQTGVQAPFMVGLLRRQARVWSVTAGDAAQNRPQGIQLDCGGAAPSEQSA